MDLALKGKRAIVTGGSRGIGKAIARRLAQEGVDVVIAARGKEQLDKTAEELSAQTGGRVVGITADTSDDASIETLVAASVELLGGVDILVNNAAQPGGVGPAGRLDQVVAEHLLNDVNVKVVGYLRTARAVAPHFIRNGWGRIINIGGLSARKTGNYIASVRNAGVSSITKNLGDELGPKGVNVVAIHPGATRTERTTEEEATKFGQSVSIGRIVDASEIASVAVFLASPLSIAINGETIATGGGSFGTIDY
jgi:NAD(P)-dependent dehydrogenase (short-subunit alcohol dehydrogenase family)